MARWVEVFGQWFNLDAFQKVYRNGKTLVMESAGEITRANLYGDGEYMERALERLLTGSDLIAAPAAPAVSVLMWWEADGAYPEEVTSFPVVAWRWYSDTSYMMPVVPGEYDLEGGTFQWGILLPSGQVDVPFDAKYDTQEKWASACREHAAAMKAAAAEPVA